MRAKLNFIESNISLKEKTYYKIGGITRYFSAPKNFDEIINTIFFAKERDLPIAVLGAGSNCVFSDAHFNGVVIALEKLSSWWWETEQFLFAECGVTNTELAEICLSNGSAGAAWMYRMPGQIGASVRMNARCYGGEMSQIVKDILTIDHHGHLNFYEGRKILLGYKHTLLMEKPEIVVGVRFHFPETQTHETIQTHMLNCEKDRNLKQHFLFPSCGSTFKNNYVYGKPSGRIFDELGLKGIAKGDAEVSQYHGNFIWNKKLASSDDMLGLAAFMRREAKDKLNVELDLEVQPIGVFTSDTFHSCQMDRLGPYLKEGDSYLTGLFYIPSSRNNLIPNAGGEEPRDFFPNRVFSSFFVNYYHKRENFLPMICAEVWQLQSFESAKMNPEKPFLRWVTVCDENYKSIFKLKPETKIECQNLWEYSVSEIFFAHPNKDNYLECEMTPYGHSLCLQFNDVRQKKKDMSSRGFMSSRGLTAGSIEDPLDPAVKPRDDMKQYKYEFGIEFNLNQLKPFIKKNFLKLQCALSLGNEQYFLAPYWFESSSCKADFHKPSKFLKIKIF